MTRGALLVLLFLCSSVFAQQSGVGRQYYYIDNGIRVVSQLPSPSDACMRFFLDGFSGGVWFEGVGEWGNDGPAIAASGIYTVPLGVGRVFQCRSFVDFRTPTTVGEVELFADARCTAGTPSSLSFFTTIASITPLNQLVAADPVPNPQCVNGCVTQHPGGSLVCSSLIEPGQRLVGAPLAGVCRENVQLTGTTCNYSGSQQSGVSDWQYVDETLFVPDGSGGGGGDSGAYGQAIALNTSQTASNTSAASSTLSTISEQLASSASSSASRHTEMMGALDSMLSKLSSINDAVKAGGSDGSGLIAGPSEFSRVDPQVEAPDGGLTAPGETHAGLSSLLNATSIAPVPAGTCPQWSLELWGSVMVLDAHCTLFEQVRPQLEALMTGLWALLALFIVLSA